MSQQDPTHSEIRRDYRELFDPMECICQVCRGIYEVWATTSPLWEEAATASGQGYLCPNCFTHLARVRSVEGSGWVLIRDGHPEDFLWFLTDRWPELTEAVRAGLNQQALKSRHMPKVSQSTNED